MSSGEIFFTLARTFICVKILSLIKLFLGTPLVSLAESGYKFRQDSV